MIQTVKQLLVPNNETALLFAYAIGSLTILGLLLALVKIARTYTLLSNLKKACVVRALPLNRSIDEFHTEAMTSIDKNNAVGQLFELLFRISRLNAKLPSTDLARPFAPERYSLSLALLPTLILIIGILGTVTGIVSMLGSPAASSEAVSASKLVVAGIQSLALALVAQLLLLPLAAIRNRLAENGNVLLSDLLHTELIPRYFRDDTREELVKLYRWGEEIFTQLAQTSDVLDEAIKKILSSTELIHSASKNIQVEKDKLTFFVDAFEKGTEKLIAYKSEVTEVLERFFKVDTKIFENHQHFNDRVAELYEHLERQNQLILDLKEELMKHEVARIDLIEEFLTREDLILKEVKNYTKSIDQWTNKSGSNGLVTTLDRLEQTLVKMHGVSSIDSHAE